MKNFVIVFLMVTAFVAISFGGLGDSTLAMKKKLQSQGAKQLCTSSVRGEGVSDIQASFGLLFLGWENKNANIRFKTALFEIGGYEDWSQFMPQSISKYEPWMPMLLRFHYMFSGENELGLDGESKKMLADIFTAFIEVYGKELLPLSGDVWLVKNDEVTDIRYICSLYLALQAINTPKTPQYSNDMRIWNRYLLDYCVAKGKAGIGAMVSVGDGGAVALASLLNLYDFTTDELLKTRVSFLLELIFADWAQDQINLTRCGARSKTTLHIEGKDSLKTFTQPFVSADMSWIKGLQYASSGSEYIYIAATTDWRMSDVVMDTLLDGRGKGEFEYRSRRPASIEAAGDNLVRLLPQEGMLKRYSYCSGEYVLGSFFTDASIDFLSETNPKGYARWVFEDSTAGLMFADGRFVQVTSDTEKCLKPMQSIGIKNILIFQQPQNPDEPCPLNVYLSEGVKDTITIRGGWLIFKEGSVWVAIKGLSSRRFGAACGYDWKDDKQFVLSEPASPLVIVTASAMRYRELAGFVEYITEHDWRIRDGLFIYNAIDKDGISAFFTMRIHGTDSATYNGKPLGFTDLMQFDSPFISSSVGSGIIAVKKDRRKLVYYIKEDKVVNSDK